MVSFNPRICKRCDHLQDTVIRLQNVSIHASVKDATPTFSFRYQNLLFQSTHL